jgi:hypothetical protein
MVDLRQDDTGTKITLLRSSKTAATQSSPAN